MADFALIHAPLGGPSTWQPVAEQLRDAGHAAIAPALPEVTSAPYWRSYAASVAKEIDAAGERPVMLAAHSGAGQLLPLVAASTRRKVAAYIFVDAVIPKHGRLPDGVGYFRNAAVNGFILPFPQQVLRAAGVDDEATLAALAAELRPLPLAVYEEPIDVFAGWPDAPCAYLRFTRSPADVYGRFVAEARSSGWICRELDGGHFHMLVDPVAVAAAIAALTYQCGVTNHQ